MCSARNAEPAQLQRSGRTTWRSTGASALNRTLRPNTRSWSSSTETWRDAQSRCESMRVPKFEAGRRVRGVVQAVADAGERDSHLANVEAASRLRARR